MKVSGYALVQVNNKSINLIRWSDNSLDLQELLDKCVRDGYEGMQVVNILEDDSWNEYLEVDGELYPM